MPDFYFLRFMKRIFLLLAVIGFLSLPSANGQSQSGRVYEFVNLPTTARITALGGYGAPQTGNDLGMALFYPALMEHMDGNQLSLNFVDYFGDINYGTAAASGEFSKLGKVNAAVQFINYGTFTHADELGNRHGEFTGAEYAVSLGWGRQLSERFSIGSNIRFINSAFEQYSSFGLAADVGFAYVNPENEWVSSLVFRNMGRQITNYEGENEPLPFDIVLGVSKKLINAPLRFSVVAHNLHNPDLTYTSPTDNEQTFLGNQSIPGETDRMAEIGDQIMRHLVFGMEFLPTRNFIVAIGYNYRRRQEMKVDTRLSTVGLSWGVGIRISHFMLQYGRAHYHLAGSPNHFSISTDLDKLFFRPTEEKPSIRQNM